MSNANFNIQLDKFLEGIPDKVQEVQKKLAFEVLTRVVDKSPVDTGRFKANWNTAIGVPDLDTSEDTDKMGYEAKQEALRVLANLDPYETVYITNNLDYAVALENGRSDQAPSGMVAVTVAEIQVFLREVIR